MLKHLQPGKALRRRDGLLQDIVCNYVKLFLVLSTSHTTLHKLEHVCLCLECSPLLPVNLLMILSKCWSTSPCTLMAPSRPRSSACRHQMQALWVPNRSKQHSAVHKSSACASGAVLTSFEMTFVAWRGLKWLKEAEPCHTDQHSQLETVRSKAESSWLDSKKRKTWRTWTWERIVSASQQSLWLVSYSVGVPSLSNGVHDLVSAEGGNVQSKDIQMHMSCKVNITRHAKIWRNMTHIAIYDKAYQTMTKSLQSKVLRQPLIGCPCQLHLVCLPDSRTEMERTDLIIVLSSQSRQQLTPRPDYVGTSIM